MIDPMEFMKYDKISDDVLVLGPNAVLKFNVSLSKMSGDKRYHFYKEFEYPSKSKEFPRLVTIKRSFDYYLSIENVQKNKTTDSKAFIRIGVSDLYRLRSQLEEVYRWIFDKKFKSLYATSRGKLILTNPIPESILGGYPQNKFLRFIPTVIGKDGFPDEKGIELTLSDYNNYVIMNIDRFMGLYYTIINFNMYQCAQSMVGYLGFPSDHTHTRISMDSGLASGRHYYLGGEEVEPEIQTVNDRVISSKRNISSLE